MFTMTGLEPSLPVSFQFWADSGLVFLSGWECYDSSDLFGKRGRRKKMMRYSCVPRGGDLSQTRGWWPKSRQVLLRTKMWKTKEGVRPSLRDKSPLRKAKPILGPKKLGPKKWGRNGLAIVPQKGCVSVPSSGCATDLWCPPTQDPSIWVWMWSRCWEGSTRAPHSHLPGFKRTWREEPWPQNYNKVCFVRNFFF